MLLRQVLADARAQRRRGCVLTCKAGLVSYYEKFGFQNRGVSPLGLGEADLVRHGGAVRPRPLTSSRRRATIPVKPQPGNARRHESGEQLCISTIWIPLRK